MNSYDRLADRQLTVEATDRTRAVRATSSGFDRHTTTVHLHGNGATGRGEDVCYEAADHEALAEVPSGAFADRLAGEYTLAGFAARLDEVDLFPTAPPSSEAARHYRRWAFESAALDLALRQADTTLGAAIDREPAPVRFAVSTRLPEGDPERVTRLRERFPGTEFKLDPTPEWDDRTVEVLARRDDVRILDLKGQYEGTEVDVPADPALYRRVIEGFPEAVVEDARVTEATRPLLEPAAGRLSWDVPVTGPESLDAVPFEPRWLNIKPSRFGTLESLFATLERCREAGVALYGGGQFELGVGRAQIQHLAALFYPEGPNDVAPGAYNDPELPAAAPTSPLPVPDDVVGFGGGW